MATKEKTKDAEVTKAEAPAEPEAPAEGEDAASERQDGLDTTPDEELDVPEPATDSYDGPDYDPNVLVVETGDWVRLGEDGAVPPEVVGHLATVTSAPVIAHNDPACPSGPGPHSHQLEDAVFLVRTHDQFNRNLRVTRNAFTDVQKTRAAIDNA